MSSSQSIFRNLFCLILICLVPILTMATGEAESVGSATVNEVGTLPVVDETVTITVAAIIPPNISDISTNTATTWAEEKTNIHVEWQTLQWGGEGRNKANLMLSSGADLPDVFLGNQIVRGVDYSYGSQGLLMPLNDYIENESVTIKALYEEHPLTKGNMTNPDGNIYSIGSMSLIRQNRPYAKVWYNKDVLDKLGFSEPETTEDFLNLLRAIRDNDVNGNGDPNDEIPFSGAKQEMGQLYTMNAFTYIDGRRINVDSQGNLWSPIITEEFQEGLKYQHQLYSEGLWDREAFVQDAEQLKQQTMQDHPRTAIIAHHIKEHFVDPSFRDYKAWFNNLPPIKGPKGNQTAAFNPFSMVPGWGAITTAAKNPLVAWRWFDFLATPEAQWRIYQGEQGTDWDYPKAGTLSFYGTEANLVEKIFMWAETEQNRAWLWMFPRQGYVFSSADDGDPYNNAARLYRQSLKYWDHVPDEKLVLGPLSMTDDEKAEYEGIRTEILAYHNESWIKFILGELDTDKDWSNYVQTIERMGLDKMLSVAQKAYDRQYR